ncbi:MAG: ATP-binding cassette domain-containing protein [Acidobacteria bacterium]|nr:ATP-binding cassette domain-containing protein [Acidobacteriota bacterium]MCW5969874.1 ATP-binding cassette domain-containing protein [Blastocatellales bacterium]
MRARLYSNALMIAKAIAGLWDTRLQDGVMQVASEREAGSAEGREALRIVGVSRSYGERIVLDRVDLRIGRGEMVVVLGPSGSGKTTLLRIIAGLDAPDAGEIHLHGRLANSLPPQQRRLGVVFQEHALFQRMSVEENIAFGLRAQRRPKQEVERMVARMLEMTGLRSHRRKYPAQLSGGERQRVAIARALAHSPEALLFDEPFSSLDAVTRLDLRREVRALLGNLDLPALFITHDQEEALELADRVVVLHDGRIEQVGSPFEVYNHPRNEFVASFLGAANLLLGRWIQGRVRLGRLQLRAVPDVPLLHERQPVKVVFRPEDVILNFQPQLLNTPYHLGRAVVEEVSYIGHSERLLLRLLLWSPHDPDPAVENLRRLSIVDDALAEGALLVVTRTKWDADELGLAPGDEVVVGLKGYRLLPHYPLGSEPGAKALG